MEEEDDDFYDPTDVVPPTQTQNNQQHAPSNGHETGDAEEEEIEVEDDDVCWNMRASTKSIGLNYFFRTTSISLQKHHQMRHRQRCE